MSTSPFSKRHRPPAAQLIYDEINPRLRAQIVKILEESSNNPRKLFSAQDTLLEKEHPCLSFKIAPRHFGTRKPLVFQFIESGNLEECLDAIEIGFKRMTQLAKSYRTVQINSNDDNKEILSKFVTAAVLLDESRPRTGSEDAIAELNRRFREHCVGYQFSPDEEQLVRTDSQFLHQECVDPAMLLLSCPGFEGPAQEFAKAHQNYRNGDGKGAVQEATKALESTIHAICHARHWVPSKNATLKPLLDFIFDKELVPKSLNSFFTGLRTALGSGLPTIGNSEARHGQGKDVKEIDSHMVEFALHLCAASILFLVKAHLAPTVTTAPSAKQ